VIVKVKLHCTDLPVDECEVNLPEGATVQALLEELVSLTGRKVQLKGTIYLVNERPVGLNVGLRNEDEVRIIRSVIGG